MASIRIKQFAFMIMVSQLRHQPPFYFKPTRSPLFLSANPLNLRLILNMLMLMCINDRMLVLNLQSTPLEILSIASLVLGLIVTSNQEWCMRELPQY